MSKGGHEFQGKGSVEFWNWEQEWCLTAIVFTHAPGPAVTARKSYSSVRSMLSWHSQMNEFHRPAQRGTASNQPQEPYSKWAPMSMIFDHDSSSSGSRW